MARLTILAVILVTALAPIICFTVGYNLGKASPCQSVESIELAPTPHR